MNTQPFGLHFAAKTALRRLLLAQRLAASPAQRARTSALLREKLLDECLARTAQGDVVALFSPHLGEPDVLAMARTLHAAGRSAALPVVQAKGAPLRFARWAFGGALMADAYGIGVPVQREWVSPHCVVLPCVGFTVWGGQYYRLGYGGGFYDRTLAQLRDHNAGVQAVGAAFAASRCFFEPQAQDEGLDGMVFA